MTPAERGRQQRDWVRDSLVRTDDGRACFHNSYARHPLARAVPQGEPTIAAMSQSIRELGEMLVVAEAYPVYGERMQELERLAGLVGMRLATLRGLIDAEVADAMGAP